MQNIQIKLNNNKIIKCELKGGFSLNESSLVGKYTRGAHAMSAECVSVINKECDKISDAFAFFFGELSQEQTDKVSQNYLLAMRKIEEGFEIERKKIFELESGETDQCVLASANVEGNSISLYDAFFKKIEGDELGLNARSTVVLHEIGHLAGLHSDEICGSIESAECLQNFALFACKIVSFENLKKHLLEKQKLADSNAQTSKDGELPDGRNPNKQPRDEGGRWQPEGKGGSGSKKNEVSSGENSRNEDKIVTIAPGLRIGKMRDGRNAIGMDVTGKNQSLEIADGKIRINEKTSIGIFKSPNGDIGIESNKPIDICVKKVKVGEFKNIKIDKKGNIIETDIKGNIPFTGSFIVNEIQKEISKNFPKQ